MRCLFTCLLFAGGFVAFSQQEDTSGFVAFKSPAKLPAKSIIFKVGIIPFFVGQVPETGELRFNYEQRLSRRQSIMAGVSYEFPNLIALAASGIFRGGGGKGGGRGGHGGGRGGRGGSIFGTNYTYEGVRGMLGYRYFPLKGKEAPAGIYFGPYLSYNFVDVRDKGALQNFEQLNYFDACAAVGYQLVKKSHFVFDITGGLGYKDNFITQPNANVSVGTELFSIKNAPDLNHVKLLMQMNFGYAF